MGPWKIEERVEHCSGVGETGAVVMMMGEKCRAADARGRRALLLPALACPYACISLIFLDLTHTVTFSVYEAFLLFTYKYSCT